MNNIFLIIVMLLISFFPMYGKSLYYRIRSIGKTKIIYDKYESLDDGKYEGYILKEYPGSNKIMIYVRAHGGEKIIVNKDSSKLEIIRTKKKNPEYFL